MKEGQGNGVEVVAEQRRPKPWTRKEEVEAAELYKTMTAAEVAKRLGRTERSVTSRLSEPQVVVVRKKQWQHWTAEDDVYLMATNDKTAARQLERSIPSCKSRRLVLRQRAKSAQRSLQ
jgi:hypothetical protein